MGDQQRRRMMRADYAVGQTLHVSTGYRVQCTEGLVEQQDGRLAHKRSLQCYALCHTA
jgi:hypothetical protein